MGVLTRNARRAAAVAGEAALAAAPYALPVIGGAAVANSVAPEPDDSAMSSTTAGQYEAADEATTDIAIGQETSTTSRKKKSNRGRTQPSIPASTTPAGATATSTGIVI